ncbi:hypothetical protein ABID44_000877 [Aquamicrobium ahrensii]|uniref:Uncharacterized protein n=1 Tax=Aquamicrobium ahrensii TaxID=469551 RepID=A0ABV2KKH6_9HYPH
MGSSISRKSASEKRSAASPARVRCPPESAARGASGPASSPILARLQRPVDVGQFLDRRLARACAPDQGKSGADAEQVGDGGGRVHLNGLVEYGNGAVDRDGAGLERQPAGNDVEKGALADAVAADQACAAGTEGKIEI